jgi:aspartate beta-hydroxylase
MSVPNTTASTFLDGLGNDICSPFFDSKGILHVVFQSSGDIMMVGSSIGAQKLHNTGGQPSSACYGSNGLLYITDYAHTGILSVDTQSGQQDLMVGVYEDKPFKGPSSIAVSSNNYIYFTDSGPIGETGLHSSTGNVFGIIDSSSGQILKPIALGTLAYPSAITVSDNGKFLYVAEMMKNRIIRYFQQPEGVYHGSVFYQLSGSVGPSCLAYDGKRGNLIVGMYETKDNNVEGIVYIVSVSTGKIISTISTKTPEITGLVIQCDFVYITEKSGSIYKCAL